MKKALCHLAVPAVLAAATVGGQAHGFSAVEHFPLQSGNQWTYRFNGSGIHTDTVLAGTFLINGVPTKAVQGSDGLTTYYTNDAQGVPKSTGYVQRRCEFRETKKGWRLM